MTRCSTLASVLLAVSAFLTSSPSVAQSSLTYKTTIIKYPGALTTSANGINNKGQVVGHYQSIGDSYHGFLYVNGQYTSLDVPDSTGTFAMGINNKGQIVGWFWDRSMAVHGFLYDKNNPQAFITLPDSIITGGKGTTEARGINDQGRVVGYHNTNRGHAGFSYEVGSYPYQNGTWNTINRPGKYSDATFPLGINNKNQVVGTYQDENLNWKQFVYSGGAFSSLPNPPVVGSTSANGINSLGHIVGDFGILQRAYLINSSQFVWLSLDQGLQANAAQSINDFGEIVGRSGDKGFLLGLPSASIDTYFPDNGTPAIISKESPLYPTILRYSGYGVSASPGKWTQLLLKIKTEPSQWIRVFVSPTPGSGGHKHATSPTTPRPHGWLFKATDSWKKQPAWGANTPAGSVIQNSYDNALRLQADKNGDVRLYYTAPQVSGDEKIIVSTEVTDPALRKTDEAGIYLSIPNLVALTSSSTLELVGQTSNHSDNHYGTADMNKALAALSRNYFAVTNTPLQVNDMSLVDGGAFDIGPTTSNPGWRLWDAPHIGHRLGLEADTGVTYPNEPFKQILTEQGWWEINEALWKSEGDHYHINLKGTGKVTAYVPSVAAIWANKSQGLLNLTFSFQNKGGLAAVGSRLTLFTLTNGVILSNTTLPIDIGAIPIRIRLNDATKKTIKVKVPTGVNTFQMTVYGDAVADSGAKFNFPLSPDATTFLVDTQRLTVTPKP